MSVEAEVSKVEAEVKKAEEVAKSYLQEAENKTETVAATAVEAVKAEIKKAVVDISTEEKLLLRELELEYVKAQMQVQSLQKIMEEKSSKYAATVEGLTKKYVVSKTEYVFDAAINAFKKL